MAELRRLDSHAAADAAERDSRAEGLLVEGLDQYFAGHYDEAIHLWTRVLFLDRAHARARAYIDRARTALAERQRRADEILHMTEDLLARGDVVEARRLFVQAVVMAGEDERVAALRTRFDRAERAGIGAPPPVTSAAAIVDVLPLGGWRRRTISAAALISAAAVGGLLVMAAMSPAVHDWVRARSGAEPAAPAAEAPDPVVLSRSDVALIRARTLYAHGRLAEALAVLDRVDRASVRQVEADQLRVEIQNLLLATRPVTAPSSTTRSSAGRP
jgi:tetratricopeptide (TPR) repeat protein